MPKLKTILDYVSIPKWICKSMTNPNWRQTMVEGMNELHSNDIWDIVSLPPNKFTMGCR